MRAAADGRMVLTIDAGNSRCKWGIFDNAGELWTHGACINEELTVANTPVAWRACERAVISNVAGTGITDRLTGMLQSLNLPAHWIKATYSACGVRNRYARPEQLGTDRWAALIAAWQHYRRACVVVNAGTALTIDALVPDVVPQQGIFLGGLIVPGLRTMQMSLVQNTADIPLLTGKLQAFPDKTGDAVYSGALAAMTGAVSGMRLRLAEFTASPVACVVSGGDAAILADALSMEADIAPHVVIVDDLVLQGLFLMEREYA